MSLQNPFWRIAILTDYENGQTKNTDRQEMAFNEKIIS